MIFLSFSAYAQDNLKPFDASNQAIIINSSQDQNDTELVMSILKLIEDKGITETNKKIDFINTFKVSNDIKEYATSLITQSLNYSDYKKDSYGTYTLQTCNNHSAYKKSSLNSQICYVDNAPNGRGGCRAQRSNVCCINSFDFTS